MTQHAIFCARDQWGVLDVSRPIGVISYDGVSVTITGDDELLETWLTYFRHPEGGWNAHLEEERPLSSLFDRMTYEIAVVVDDAQSELYVRAMDVLEDCRHVVIRQDRSSD